MPSTTNIQTNDIDCVGVSRKFGSTAAVQNVSLSVASGEFLALLGPSGCGKTTLLRMIGGFDAPTFGEIRLKGQNVGHLPPERRPTNMVFQSGALFPHLSVARNIAYGLRHDGLNKSEITSRVRDMLELVGLSGFENRRPHQLSGGQAQRVAIARALVKRPDVLLLDEPLSALDLQLQLHLRRELRALHRRLGTTFVLVTHNQQEALELADRVAVMRNGQLEQIGTGEEIYNRPASAFVASFIGETNLLPARVIELSGARTILNIGGQKLVADISGLKIGDASVLAVRPDSLEWSRDDQSNGSSLVAIVEDVHFFGGRRRLHLKVPTLNQTLLADIPDGQDAPSNGTRGYVKWLTSAARVLPASEVRDGV